MRYKIVIFLLTLALASCNQENEHQSELSTYTKDINKRNLKKKVLSIYPNGVEKAVIFFDTEVSTQQPIKEIHYYEDGIMQVEGTIKNGLKHGTWIFYHNNGYIWSKGNFKEGKSEGTFEIFNPDGTIKIKSYYKKGKKIKEEIYKNGKLKETVNLSDSDLS